MIGTIPCLEALPGFSNFQLDFPHQVECHYCGYEPPSGRIGPWHRCPKCGGSAWETFVRPRTLLLFANHTHEFHPNILHWVAPGMTSHQPLAAHQVKPPCAAEVRQPRAKQSAADFLHGGA